jgi:hypothetical protein
MTRIYEHRIFGSGAILLAWLFASSSMGLAQNNFDLGGLAGSAMRMGFGARGMTMANALSADASGDGTGYYNPAVVPFQLHPSALISAGILPLDRSLNSAGYIQSLKPTGGFSLALINAGVSKLQGRDHDGLPTETYSTSENEFLFTFGTKLHSAFAVGVSAKIFYYSLFTGVKSTTVGFDIGILYVPISQVSIGIVVADINSKYKWDTSQLYGADGNTTIDHFPLRRKIALCYSPSWLDGRMSGELEWVGSVLISRVGAEIPLHESFTVRGGIDQIDFQGRISAKPSLGFSLRTTVRSWQPSLDYGYIIEPYTSGGIHVLSVRVSFQ